MKDKIVILTERLIKEVFASEEYKRFVCRTKLLMESNLDLKPGNVYIVTIQGKIIVQVNNMIDLIDSSLTRELSEVIDELGVIYFTDLYGVDDWVDVYDVYESKDFEIINQFYKNLSDEVFTEIKYKANPYEDENIQGYGDRTWTFFNFRSIDEYVRYLVFEGLQNIQMDLKSGLIEDEYMQKLDDEGYPIIDDEGTFGWE